MQVQVEQGTLKGCWCKSIETSYLAFKGIPYAKPPIGELRFKAPEPPERWESVRDATEHAPVCPQYSERFNTILDGSEDCLYLNVYTKDISPSQPVPVMVWIHGGSFYTGAGDSDFYGPEFFMEKNVVLVTFNYRLEVFGFLCLNTEEVPGNAGMKDQVLAMKWIKNNIAVFGGDPNNITIFGCSAGASSTSFHLISPMSRGLFNKAICQSGVCLNEWSYNIYGYERAFQLGKLLGKETDDPDELLRFLRTVPTSSLIRIKLPVIESSRMDIADGILFCPVIEKCNLTCDKFLPEAPIDLINKGLIADVPLILGYTSGEGIEIARFLSGMLDFYQRDGAVVPRELKMKWPLDKIKEADQKIRRHYFQSRQITEQMIQQVSDLESDKLFIYNILRFAHFHAIQNRSLVYIYKFVADTERNFTKKSYKMDSLQGVCHADDLPYLFNITNPPLPLTIESLSIIKTFVTLWTNFACVGNPTPTEDYPKWKPFMTNEENVYTIGKTLECSQNENNENIKFWKSIYEELEPPQ